MDIQRTKNKQNNFEKEEPRGLTLPDFKTYYKLQQSKQHNIGVKTNRSMVQIEYRA